MGTIFRSPQDLNRIMPQVVPELDSEYARFPLKEPRWYQPNEKGPKGEPCFISSPNDQGVRKDYVWCKNGPNGKGYYHLMTKIAYTNLYSRINGSPPGGCCNFSAQAKQDYQDWDDVKRVVFNRYNSPRPDDAFGAEKSMGDAYGMAQAAYMGENGIAVTNMKWSAVKTK